MTTLGELIAARMSRRTVLGGLAGTASALALLGGLSACEQEEDKPAAATPSDLGFTDLPQMIADGDAVAQGYQVQRVISWGDPIISGGPVFNPAALTAVTQGGQFGYNNDFMAYLPLPRGSDSSNHGLLVVNHEYTNPELIFANYDPKTQTQEQTAMEIAAHGLSVLEIQADENGKWHVLLESHLNRRITGGTQMAISGPAAGALRLRTSADPEGRTVLGTFGNCSGGVTPWGTVLSCEENTPGFFGGANPLDLPQYASYDAMGFTKTGIKTWYKDLERFNLAKEPMSRTASAGWWRSIPMTATPSR